MSDLHAILTAIVRGRLAMANLAELKSRHIVEPTEGVVIDDPVAWFQQFHTPADAVRRYMYDLETLEYHFPSDPNERAVAICVEDGRTWPCRTIGGLAYVYEIEGIVQ